MNRADTCAGQHGHSRFRDHRHIDRDAVAFLGAEAFQSIRQPAYALVQVPIGNLLSCLAIVAFPDDRDLIGSGLKVPVETVCRNV